MNTKIIEPTQKKKTPTAQHATAETLSFGILLAMVGGFLDAYTFVSRGGVFANAQTGNIVLFGVYMATGHLNQALLSIPPILAFVFGVIATESIKKHPTRLFVLDWPRAILIFEIIILSVIGFIPNTVPHIFVNVAISFVASVQVSSFRKLVDSAYSTTMTTGNLRVATQSAYLAIRHKDQAASVRAIRYFTIVFSFLFGAIGGGVLTSLIGVKSVWIPVILLIHTIILFTIGEKKNRAVA